MFQMSRRDFVKSSGAAALTPWFQKDDVRKRQSWQSYYNDPPPDRAVLRNITTRGVDAARSAGAEYADTRITQYRWIVLSASANDSDGGLSFYTRTVTGVGVRALVNGCWGYASHTTWSPSDVTRLASEAVGAAKASSLGPQRTVSLAPVTPVSNGDWHTPIRIDPFQIPIDEIMDEMLALCGHPSQLRQDVDSTTLRMELTREYRAFASTDGTFNTQTFHRTGGDYVIGLKPHWRSGQSSSRKADTLTIAGAGWEYILDLPLRQEIPRLLDEADRARFPKDVNIGRYDVVFDAQATSAILSASLGTSTDLTRAMGYDANAAGTSFLDDPVQMLGTLKVASPLVTITANRSMPGGTSTVKWDEEGVEPDEFTIVKDGLLTDFQTSRESSAWIADYYQKQGRPVRSHGCTGSDSAIGMISPYPPNFMLAPAAAPAGLQDLCKGIDLGYLVLGGESRMDHQCITGYHTNALVFEIRNGVIGDTIAGAGFVLNTLEFWKSIDTIGGRSSRQTFNSEYGKSYGQRAMRSIQTPPVRVKNIATIDMRRKRS